MAGVRLRLRDDDRAENLVFEEDRVRDREEPALRARRRELERQRLSRRPVDRRPLRVQLPETRRLAGEGNAADVVDAVARRPLEVGAREPRRAPRLLALL